MKITLGGTAGSGKSTAAKLLAKKLGYKHYSMGDFQREIAEEKGISLLELGKLEEKVKSLDEEVDQRQIELGRKEDNFVIDSRLGFHFIPNSRAYTLSYIWLSPQTYNLLYVHYPPFQHGLMGGS